MCDQALVLLYIPSVWHGYFVIYIFLVTVTVEREPLRACGGGMPSTPCGPVSVVAGARESQNEPEPAKTVHHKPGARLCRTQWNRAVRWRHGLIEPPFRNGHPTPWRSSRASSGGASNEQIDDVQVQIECSEHIVVHTCRGGAGGATAKCFGPVSTVSADVGTSTHEPRSAHRGHTGVRACPR